ncbi:MAG: T9SS type A sorting domain-containing protein [Fidelibacterota bacterium]
MVILFNILPAQSYNWPCEPFDQQHWINGTFCENRSGSSGEIDHFHDGVDIHLPQGGATYSPINGTVTSIGTPGQYGINSWVRVGRYAAVHINPNPVLHVGSQVTAYQTVLGWTNSWNHIHFKDGYPGSEINPIRQNGGLTPLVDNYNPAILTCDFYVNGTQTAFVNHRVYGVVDIVSRAMDTTDDGPLGSNNGVYQIGYEIMDSAGTVVAGPHIPFTFDAIPSSNSYVHNVFFPGSNTSTYFYIVTNNLNTDGTLDMTNWPLGNYTARIFTWDPYFNADTLEQPFEVVAPDLTPPAAPVLLSILPEGGGFHLRWLPNAEPDLAGYRLYFSFDLIQWQNSHNEATLTATITDFVAPVMGDDMIFIKMTAVDDAPLPNESAFSEIYTLRRHATPEPLVLFVDAYSRNSNSSTIPFVAHLGEVAENLDYLSYATVNDTLFSLDTSLFQSDPYDNAPLIIHTGQSHGPLNAQLLNAMITRLTIEEIPAWVQGFWSLEILQESDLGSNLLTQLQISSGTYTDLPDSLLGTAQSLFQGFQCAILDTVTGINGLATITIGNGAASQPVLVDSEDSTYGVAAKLPGFFLYTAMPVEIIPQNKRTPFLSRVMNAVSPPLTNTPEILALPQKVELTVYPNPFNDQAVIRLAGGVGKVDLHLYNLRGEEVWQTSINKDVPPFTLIISNSLTHSLASGVYLLQAIYRDNQPMQVAKQKVVYLK